MNKIANSDFDIFINNINVTQTETNRLMSSHRNVKEKIQESSFNERMIKTYLSGSYKKKTMIRTNIEAEGDKKVDVDVLIIMDYAETEMKPQSLLDQMRNVLEEIKEYKGKTRIQKRSIGIELSKTHIDVIPVLEVSEGKDKPLYISSPNKQIWEETNPILSIEYLQTEKQNKLFLIDVIKVLKWWKKYNKPKNYNYPISYALEILVCNFYQHDNNKLVCMIKTFNEIKAFLEKHEFKPHFYDPTNAKNDLFKKMNSASYESFRNKFISHSNRLTMALNNENIKVFRDIFSNYFPNCTIINDRDLNQMKTQSKGLVPYAR